MSRWSKRSDEEKRAILEKQRALRGEPDKVVKPIVMNETEKKYEEARLDALNRHNQIETLLKSEEGQKLPQKIKEMFTKAKDLWWKRAFIMYSFRILLGNGMMFSALEKDHSGFKDMAKDERKAVGILFIQLHVSDLQLCNCSDFKVCNNCRDCIDFLRGNVEEVKLTEYLQGRAWPIGWHNDPEFEPFKQIQKEQEGDKSSNVAVGGGA